MWLICMNLRRDNARVFENYKYVFRNAKAINGDVAIISK